MLRFPTRIDESDPARRLTLLWREALANPLHTAFCGCMGGGGITLHADLLEEDLLDFLQGRYRDNLVIATFLQRRRADRAADFSDWLPPAVALLPQFERQAIIADVTGVLESMTGQAPGAGF